MSLTKKQFIEFIYENYKLSMHALANSIVYDQYTSEDLFHDSLIIFEQKYDQLIVLKDNELVSYIHKAIKNKAINHVNRSKRHLLFEPEKFNEIAVSLNYYHPANDNLVYQEMLDEILDYLNNISAQQAHIFELKYIEEMTNNEISSSMNLTNSNARVLIHRTRKNAQDFILKATTLDHLNNSWSLKRIIKDTKLITFLLNYLY